MRPDTILVVEDDADARRSLVQSLAVHGLEVRDAARAEHFRLEFRSSRPDVLLLDSILPDADALECLAWLRSVDSDTPVILMTGDGSVELAIESMKHGADYFVSKPVDVNGLLTIIRKALETRRTCRKQFARSLHRPRFARDPFLGRSAEICRLAEDARRVGASDTPVLIQGETGTGKGVLATWLHNNGPRADEPFVDLNCAGLSRELLESELFGHERGAFTGAVNSKTGLLEAAHRGTVFLDEIGDIDPLVQPKLLKVLEEKRFRRLGEVRDRSIDIRLIAASHRDLRELVSQQRFRSDLLFRINTVTLRIPPLRERREDIPPLAECIVGQLRTDLNRSSLGLADDAVRALCNYHWPGNIRELRNVLERAALIGADGVIHARDLHFELLTSAMQSADDADLSLAEVEKRHIVAVLRRERGKVERAAVRLGMARSTLYSRLKEYGICVTRTIAELPQ